MTVTAPPRPPRPSDPVDREELEALVEALIEEARQRARRRRRIYAASAALVALVVVAVSTAVDRATQPDTASPALAARSGGLAGAATPKIAYIREPLHMGYAGVLWVMNRDGSGQRRLAPAFGGMRWSPDGQKIAFTAWSDKTPTSDVFVMNADGSGKERLTRDPGWESGVAWSPDGQKIAFARVRDGGKFEIYTMNTDGSEQRRLTSEAWGGEHAWSPVGDKIAFVSRRDGNAEIYRDEHRREWAAEPDAQHGGRQEPGLVARRPQDRLRKQLAGQRHERRREPGQRRLTRKGRNFAPAWSPDGQKIAFERRFGRKKYGPCNGCGRASTFEIWVMNADGSGQQRLTAQGAQPGWSPDGQKIAFMSERNGNAEIYTMNADGSQQQNLTRTRGGKESGLVWSPAQK